MHRLTSVTLALALGTYVWVGSCAQLPPEVVDLGLEQIANDNPPVPPQQRYGTNLSNFRGGHNFIVDKAFQMLDERDLLPEELKAYRDLVQYGVDFADHSWLGRPENIYSIAVNPMTQNVRRYKCHNSDDWTPPGHDQRLQRIEAQTCECAVPKAGIHDETYSSADIETEFFDPWPFGGTIRIEGRVEWKRGCRDHDKASVTPYFQLGVNVLTAGVSGVPEIALDNLFHFPYADLRYLADTDPRSWSVRVRLLGSKEMLEFVSDWEKRAVLNSYTQLRRDIFDMLNDQPILSPRGHGYGSISYGAVLFQLSRKFFTGSRAEPRLSELIFVKEPFVVDLKKPFDSLKLTFPATYLGGMPFICSPGEGTNPCLNGHRIWPIWVPEKAAVPSDGFKSLLQERPGRSDRVASIYLGWAAHMIQDNMIPSHSANWHGPEHERQEAFVGYRPLTNNAPAKTGHYESVRINDMDTVIMCGDQAATLVPPSGEDNDLWTVLECDNPIAISMDAYIRAGVSATFASGDRREICHSLGIRDEQLRPGDLNFEDVIPFFASAARVGYDLRYRRPHNSLIQMRNAVLATMELLLCAPPLSPVAPDQSCEPVGVRRCLVDYEQVCGADFLWAESDSCRPDGGLSFCQDGECFDACAEGAARCIGDKVYRCHGDEGYVYARTCAPGTCKDGECVDAQCSEWGARRCTGDQAQVCRGTWKNTNTCTDGPGALICQNWECIKRPGGRCVYHEECGPCPANTYPLCDDVRGRCRCDR